MKRCTEKAEARFESQYGIRRSAEVAIAASTPPEMAGLQAVDYCLVFERPSDAEDGKPASTVPHLQRLAKGRLWRRTSSNCHPIHFLDTFILIKTFGLAMADKFFSICTPRIDVLQGALREGDFAADLSQVLRGDAPDECKRTDHFCANTYPTKGLKTVVKLVAMRVLGRADQ